MASVNVFDTIKEIFISNMPTSLIVVVGFVVIYIFIFIMAQKRKANNKKVAEKYLEQYPDAAKVYYYLSLTNTAPVEVSSVDGDKPVLFSEGMKQGFYISAGAHDLNISCSYSTGRRRMTTVGPVKVTINPEANKTYSITYDTYIEQFSFKEI